jgi:hypothetical protein
MTQLRHNKEAGNLASLLILRYNIPDILEITGFEG